MAEHHPSDHVLCEDAFQLAAAAAETETGKRRWSEMLPAERSAAIYSSLRSIDAKRVMLRNFVADPNGRYRVAGDGHDEAA